MSSYLLPTTRMWHRHSQGTLGPQESKIDKSKMPQDAFLGSASLCVQKCICGQVSALNPTWGACLLPDPLAGGEGITATSPRTAPALGLWPQISALRASTVPSSQTNSWLRLWNVDGYWRRNLAYKSLEAVEVTFYYIELYYIVLYTYIVYRSFSVNSPSAGQAKSVSEWQSCYQRDG